MNMNKFFWQLLRISFPGLVLVIITVVATAQISGESLLTRFFSIIKQSNFSAGIIIVLILMSVIGTIGATITQKS